MPAAARAGSTRHVCLGWAGRCSRLTTTVAPAARILRELTTLEPGLPEVNAILACADEPTLWPNPALRQEGLAGHTVLGAGDLP